MSTAPIDWQSLVDEAIRRRKAERLSQRSLAALAGVSVPTVNAFEQGEINLRFDRVVAILSVLGLFAAPETDLLASFVRTARSRFDARVEGQSADHWTRTPHGHFELAFEIVGLTAFPMKMLREWLAEQPSPTIWDPFGAPSDRRLQTIDNALEHWEGTGQTADPTRGAFWRIDPRGLGFVRDGYREDAPGVLSPGAIFDLSLPIHHLASMLRQAASLARLAGADETAPVRVRGRYQGLSGRVLQAWADPKLRESAPEGARALSDVADIDLDLDVGLIESDPATAISMSLAPLYERFSGFVLERSTVAAQLGDTGRKQGVSIGPFAVSKDLVAKLGDEALRDLLGKLLEAEAAAQGVPLTGIDLGGGQTAPDGGIDARLQWREDPKPKDWLPARDIIFQCKAQVLAPAAILREMRPNDRVRPIFAELASVSGAYILFTTDDIGSKGQADRIAKMREALSDLPNANRITLDFLGPDRIARWANQHPGVALWLLQAAGRPLRGWRPYGNWSAEASADTPYLLDDTARAKVGGIEGDIREALAAIRSVLSQGSGCVRLVGISGMGKTRLAEALFDQRIIAGPALPTALAVYADAGLELGTGAPLVAEQLVLAGTEAVLIVDNATARTHAQLAEIVKRTGSRVSLLSIDYDIEDEAPDDTLVVRLEGNSGPLLQSLLKQRVPRLSDSEVDHLAGFSEGNARVALAIARGATKGVNLATASDAELIDRLFQVERGGDPEARQAANAAALVYAFHAEGSDGQAEYPVLAEIAGITPAAFYRHIETMIVWGLAQKRGAQRAVKPDPIANQLAAAMLRLSDPETILRAFAAGPERLFASFARRLGQLEAEPRAAEIAKRLIAPNGWLSAPADWSDEQERAFFGLAPSAPEAVLGFIERALPDGNEAALASSYHTREDTGKLLVHLAYDPLLFERAMLCLASLIRIDGRPDNERSNLREDLLERFWPALSWTQAPLAPRLSVIDRLLDDPDLAVRSLGLEALDHMLDTDNLSSSFAPAFGSQPRLSEWRPRGADYVAWIDAAASRIHRIVETELALASRARSIVAQHLRSHAASGIEDKAIALARQIKPLGYWDEGWRSANDALHFGSRTEALQAYEYELRPKNEEQFFEAFVIGEPWRHWHPAGKDRRHTRKVEVLASGLGRRLARHARPLDEYLRRAVAVVGESSTLSFGEGLGQGTSDIPALWAKAYQIYRDAPEGQRDAGALIGIARAGATRDPAWGDATLDAAATDPLLQRFIIYLHTRRPLGPREIDRFIVALDRGASPEHLSALMFGGVTAAIPAEDLSRLLRRLIAHPDGVAAASQILQMRFFGDTQKERDYAPELVEVARLILTDPRSYDTQRRRSDRELSQLAKIVLRTEQGAATAVVIARHLRGLKRVEAMDEFDDLGRVVLDAFPRIVLDELVLGTTVRARRRGLLDQLLGGVLGDRDGSGEDKRPSIDVDLIRSWVAEDPQTRATRLAELVPYTFSSDAGGLAWSDAARALIDLAPDPLPILSAFEDRFFSGVSSGPFSGRYLRRLPMVASLKDHFDPRVRNWAREAEVRLHRNIEHWDTFDREDGSRFE